MSKRWSSVFRIFKRALIAFVLTLGAVSPFEHAQAYCWARSAPAEIEQLRKKVAISPERAIRDIERKLQELAGGRKNPQQAAWLYAVLAGAQFALNGTDEVTRSARKGLSFAPALRDPAHLDLRIALANSMNDTQSMHDAIADFSKLESASANDNERVCLLIARGVAYDTLNESRPALEDLTRAYVLSRRLHLDAATAESANMLAIVLSYRQLIALAVPLFDQALQWQTREGLTYEAAMTVIRTGLGYRWAGDAHKSILAMQPVLRDAHKIGIPIEIMGIVHANMCRAYVQIGKLEKADEQCALSDRLASSSPPLLGTVLRARAELAVAGGKPREALRYLDRSAQISIGTPFPEEIYVRVQAYAALGDRDRAYATLQKFVRATEQQARSDRAFQSDAFAARISALEKEGERAALDRELRLTKEREQAQRLRVVIVTAAAIIIISLIGSIALLRRRHQRKIVEMAAAAERQAQEKIVFLARLSHEVRSPIGGMTLLASTLRRQEGIRPEHSALLEKLDEAGRRVVQLLSDMLEFSRLEAGELSLSPGPINLRSFLADVTAAHEYAAEERGLEIFWEIDQTVPGTIVADGPRLRQVLDNLLANAVRFTDQGMVGVKVTMSTEGQLQFNVIDTGIGIPVDQIPRLFRPWQQVDSPDHQRGGTGLGLQISSALVQKMGGAIRAIPADMGGTIMQFTLPISPELSGQTV